MPITPSVIGAFAAAAISLVFFIRFLVFTFFRKKQKVYFWLTFWFLGAMVFGTTRLMQFIFIDGQIAVTNSKIVNIVGLVIMPVILMAFISEYTHQRLQKAERLLIGFLQLTIGIAVLSRGVVFGGFGTYTTIFDEKYSGLVPGAFPLPIGIMVIGVAIFSAVRVLKSKTIPLNNRNVISAVLFLAPTLLFHDIVTMVFHLPWFRLYDYYFLVMGISFDIYLYMDLINIFGKNEKEIIERTKELEASNNKIRNLAYYDELTGLPNKNQLFEWFETSGQTFTNKKMAVYLLDIRNFNNINEYFGLEKGDEFLLAIARRLEKLQGKSAMLARFEGVRLVYAKWMPEYEDPALTAEKLVEALSMPVETGNLSYRFDLNIGASIFPEHGDRFQDILKNSGIALAAAKKKASTRYELFSRKLLEYIDKRRIMEMDLSVSIWNNELRLVYQPQYDLKRHTIRGFEALLRWKSSEYGEISPVEFIPIAEETGLIIQIGEWVIRQVAEKASEIREKYNLVLTFCINISPIQLMNRSFLELLEELAERNPKVKDLLEFEITEGVMVAYEEGMDVFNRTKALGYQLALDDFGTGYSSLSYLKRLPIDILKIDRSFIKELEDNKGYIGIAENIIDIGHKMNLKVVAEGVETEEQMNILKECKCDFIQGYYYSRPMEEENLEEYIEEQLYKRYSVNE